MDAFGAPMTRSGFMPLARRADHLFMASRLPAPSRSHILAGDGGDFAALRAIPGNGGRVGSLASVAYAPALSLALVCTVLTVKALLTDIAQTQLRREVRRLNQRNALIDVNGKPSEDLRDATSNVSTKLE